MSFFDDFLLRAILGTIAIVIAAGPMGCIIIWQRMAYFGDTMAHSALLGVAVAFVCSINITLAIFAVTLLLALILLLLQRQRSLSSDSLLGILSHSTLAISLVILSFLPWIRQDLSVYLFGDVLAISKLDLIFISCSTILSLFILALLWRTLIATTVSPDLAAAEGLHPEKARMVFMLLLALIIAVAIKIVGILLITALLILPAATARSLATTPEKMAILAIFWGILSASLGLYASSLSNSPAGPSIIVAAFLFFLLNLIAFAKFFKRKKQVS